MKLSFLSNLSALVLSGSSYISTVRRAGMVSAMMLVMMGAGLSACFELGDDTATQNATPPAPKVVVAQPLVKQIVEWDEYTGRFDAVERVDIRARVSGYLDEIRFTDGQFVTKGDVLFVIDQRPFKIALDRAQAQLELAKKEMDRAKNLRAASAISQEQVDRRLQEYLLAKANVDEAKLNLEFSEVKSPITGKIGESLVDVGNLIDGGAQSATVLTTVVTIDPIHFYFEASEGDYLKYSRLDLAGRRPGSNKNANPIFVQLQDEDDFSHAGKMDFVDNVIDQSTGTVEARAILDNKDGFLYPGLFGRARVVASLPHDALLIPDDAILSNQTKKVVMTVDGENKVVPKFVELGGLRKSGLRIVESGLTPQDKIIINGLVRARPGASVDPDIQAITEDDMAEDHIEFPREQRPEFRDDKFIQKIKE